jgi:hypothetical protein
MVEKKLEENVYYSHRLKELRRVLLSNHYVSFITAATISSLDSLSALIAAFLEQLACYMTISIC